MPFRCTRERSGTFHSVRQSKKRRLKELEKSPELISLAPEAQKEHAAYKVACRSITEEINGETRERSQIPPAQL